MPVDVASGAVELAFDDVAIQGKVTLLWDRRYSTALLGRPAMPFGEGWTNRYSAELTRVADGFEFRTPHGVVETMNDVSGFVERGGRAANLGAFLEVFKVRGRYIVQHWDPDAGEVWRYCFEGAPLGRPSRLRTLEDVTGQALDLVWDARGLLAAVNQPAERRVLRLIYTPFDLVESVVLEAANGERHMLMRYEYDAARRLAAAYDAAGNADRYEYDADGRILREIVKDGGIFSYRYDSTGRCVRTSGLDRYDEKRLCFLAPSRTTTVTDSYDKTYLFQYLSTGQVVREVDPIGGEKTTAYDDLGRIVAQTDANGASTHLAYDQSGNRVSITDALGNAHTFEYTEDHLMVSMIDPLQQVWRRAYDSRNRLVETSDPLGNRWLFAYDEEGNVAEVTNPLGNRKQQRHARGFLTSVTDWTGHETRVGLDVFGRVLETIGPLGDSTRIRYDPLGNNTEMILPDGSLQRATYDVASNLTSFSDGSGFTTTFRYGPCGRVLERIDPLGQRVRYVWGSEPGRLEQVVNERNEVHSFVYDAAGRIIEERLFDGATRLFEYDVDGHAIAYTNANGDRITMERDALHRVVAANVPDAGLITYRFDAAGRLSAARNAFADVSFDRDPLGRILRESQGDHWIASRYDAIGNILRTTTSLGHTVEYVVDGNGYVSKLTTLDNQSLEFARDPHNRTTRMHMPGSVVMDQFYDGRGRPIDQRVRVEPGFGTGRSISTEDSLVARRYQYDGRSSVTSIIDDRWGRVDFAYDPAERLIRAARERAPSETFAYDATGNIAHTQTVDEAVVDEELVHGAGDRLLRKGTTRYEYDNEGRRIAKIEAADSAEPRTWRYEWDALDHLRTVTRPNGTVWQYNYDALGRRVEKVGPVESIQFVWDREAVVHETREMKVSATWIFDFDSFEPVATVQGSRLYSAINDHLGTPRELVDDSGSVSLSIVTRAWGRDIARASGEIHLPECPIRFQGQWLDDETGLSYNRFRYYDSDVGAFISKDPVGLEGGTNVYLYVRNPIGWIDPWGLVNAPASLPDTPGVYIITNGNTSYVGNAGQGAAGMNTRTSNASHASAQALLSKPGTTVQFVEVNLGTATTRSDKNNILRFYEQREYQKQIDKGFNMLNDPKSPPQAASKKAAAEKLIKDKKASASSRRKTCTG